VDLARLAREGDVEAYERLVQRYQRLAFRVAWMVVRDPGEAEDAVQDAFVKAWYALPSFRPGSPFRPWILRIVSNEAKNRARSARRRDDLALRAGAVRVDDQTPSPEVAALAHEEATALVRAMGQLNDRDRQVIAYRYLFDLSEAELAQTLGVRPGTAKSRLSRAMSRLRDVLQTQEVSSA
jgi:RNA polymerase sigma factor (sigma-70 family)